MLFEESGGRPYKRREYNGVNLAFESAHSKGRALRALFIQNAQFPYHVVCFTLYSVLDDYRHAR